MNTAPMDVDQYIAQFPSEVQVILQQIRALIKQAAPDAVESISYGIPAYYLNGRQFIYFAGYKKHVSLYPVPRQHEAFEQVLSEYKGGRGTAQFPLSKPLPLDLIAEIVKFRIQENQEKATKKKAAPKPSGDCFSLLAAPARRALANHGITTLPQLASLTEKEVLALHGMGKSSLPKLREALIGQGLDFRK
ncbi:DUF1801 domain-containing protein [Telluribacter humicola]|uniref:DUF1801 domain-containing protein n=1 Tax=Telluribacter humicola TaxID=1720261 RepID=UPI00286DB54A|nr:DUF1801 domain-containing protein [Telluribacter humicola]